MLPSYRMMGAVVVRMKKEVSIFQHPLLTLIEFFPFSPSPLAEDYFAAAQEPGKYLTTASLSQINHP